MSGSGYDDGGLGGNKRACGFGGDPSRRWASGVVVAAGPVVGGLSLDRRPEVSRREEELLAALG